VADEEAAGAEGPGGEDAANASIAGDASVAPSITSGLETPLEVEVRKGGRIGRAGAETPAEAPKALYTVLEQKETALSGGLIGTKHTYVLPPPGGGTGAGLALGAGGEGEGIALNLAPEELGKLSEAELAAKYEAEVARVASAGRMEREDVSDLLAEQEKKASRKRKAGGDGDGDGAKKARKAAKDFKF
jgi:hypothetical protein